MAIMPLGGLTAIGAARPAGAATYAYEPPDNPPATPPYYGNYIGGGNLSACGLGSTTPACEQAEVYMLNDARFQINGMGPFQIPDDFFTLPLDEQLFILTNEDRVAYGEEPLQGISGRGAGPPPGLLPAPLGVS